ncbi:GAF and ANTAR domain-containing protein [Mycolicibacterium sphagni]|uniref:Response regulator receiver protein n=1 Tax=Mycolicibacterium sphagni TaxID=1786 RepID=A0A255DN36_9MYCO|nr:GAF and ANTAR domain-containing protein [Mycolicibacterium sphagni]MCV7177380.1 GAF and ANTAR domain-containing protein [Mycolicibacterium sphagni]OYN77063.1 response regulator receiver protein [Mycolicibacterium sphagni]
MPAQSSRELARTLGDLAVRMQAQKGTGETLHTIVEAAADIVPGARWVGISLIQGRKVLAKAPTDPIAAKLDELQNELGDGPCLTALRDHQTVHIEDMSTEDRWPEFSRQAMAFGVHSMLSFQLFVESENLGAMNLYGAEARCFSKESVEVGTVVAQHAAVAMFGAAAAGQFQSALASRDVIGQAKGILMHRNNVSGGQAFAMLTRASADTNIKLVDVARWLVSEHESDLE